MCCPSAAYVAGRTAFHAWSLAGYALASERAAGELICFSRSLLPAAGPWRLLVTSAPRLAHESHGDKPPTPALPLLRIHRMPTKPGFASAACLASGKWGYDIQPSVAGSVLRGSGGTVCGRGHGVRLVRVHRSIAPSVCSRAADLQRSRSHWPAEAGMGGRGQGFGCSLNKPSCVGKAQPMFLSEPGTAGALMREGLAGTG